MLVSVLIEWEIKETCVIGEIEILKIVRKDFQNPFNGSTFQGSGHEKIYTEKKEYKSQLAFFRHIVNNYYLSKRFKWQSVCDENNLMILEGEYNE